MTDIYRNKPLLFCVNSPMKGFGGIGYDLIVLSCQQGLPDDPPRNATEKGRRHLISHNPIPVWDNLSADRHIAGKRGIEILMGSDGLGQSLRSILGCVMAQPGTSPRTVFAKAEDGELHHISSVALGTPNLTCPDCGLELIAKPGRGGRVPHFAHRSSIECRQAGETNAHLMAKAAIAEAGGLMLPAFTVVAGGEKMTALQAQWFSFERIEIEQTEVGFRPDLVGYTRHPETSEMRRLLIEVFVTNQVGPEKIARVTAAGESAIEIDLSKIKRDLTGPEFIKQILEAAPRRWIYHRSAEELRRKARLVAARAAEKKDRQKAFAIAKEAEREEERQRARQSPPGKTNDYDLDWANQDRSRWGLLDMEGLFTGPADDGIFDVAPVVWRAWVLSMLAPWRNEPYPLPNSDGFAKLTARLGKEMRTREWVKAPFAGDLRKFQDTRYHPWDPVAEAIAAYITYGLRDYGLGGDRPWDPVNLSSVAGILKVAWQGRQSWGRDMLTLRDCLTEHGVEAWLSGARLESGASVDDAIRMRGAFPGFNSSVLPDMIREVATGATHRSAPRGAEVYAFQGIELRLPGDTGEGCTQRALGHIRQSHMQSWRHQYQDWLQREASRLLSVFRDLADRGILASAEISANGLEFLFNEGELLTRIHRTLPDEERNPLAAARAASTTIITRFDTFADHITYLAELTSLRASPEWQEIILREGVRSALAPERRDGFRRAMHRDMRPVLSKSLSELTQTIERWGYGADFPERALASRPPWSEGRLIDLVFGGNIQPFRRAMNEIITRRQPPKWVITHQIGDPTSLPPEIDHW